MFLVLGMISMSSCKKDLTATGSPPYFPEVRTIVQNNCISCHYQGGQGMPVVLTSDMDIANYAASIKAATCDTPTFLIKRMPLDGELSDEDKAIIRNWFERGGSVMD